MWEGFYPSLYVLDAFHYVEAEHVIVRIVDALLRCTKDGEGLREGFGSKPLAR